MVADLPVELWLEILSHLPQGTLPKMIGINRYLFEAGMDELYKEINLEAGAKVERYVEQLQYVIPPFFCAFNV
ncbi:hypothetical protein P691DRAFT_668885 [Macrolepiota fuliginosa MF-IS2]|uniref:F-box domain-containing protein n=1 Tax=Macrolepiota fuliginosa MF-IS2 TaxID=1400762 RepID=A0A9P6C4T0_9AGAR|nr:hypothetical protein P691DRAFT_668885 [Macrolepiota fuliginosa MF-IS2]